MGLSRELIREVIGRPGMLPLLQYTLNELWETDGVEDKIINTRSYKSLGGIRGALQNRMDAFTQKLADENLDALRRVMLRLVDIGQTQAGVQAVSRRARVDEFDDEDAEEMVRRLVDAKLLVSTGEKADEESIQAPSSTVELAHEALIEGWPRFQDWIEGNKEALVARNRIRDDCERYGEAIKCDKNTAGAELLTGSRLEQALELRGSGEFERLGGRGLTKEESNFLDESRKSRDRKRERERKILVSWITAVSSLAILVTIAFVAALHENQNAVAARNRGRRTNPNCKNRIRAKYLTQGEE